MRRALVLALGLVLASPSLAHAQRGRSSPQGPIDLILAVDARRTSPSGSSSAGDHGDSTFEAFAYSPFSDLCGLGTGNNEPERTPWIGWHFQAEVLGSTVGPAGPELNVRVTWERRWENGVRTSNGPRGTNTVTMRGGDVLVLDRVTPATQGRCGNELRLEASVMSASARRFGGPTVGGRGGVIGGGRGGVGGGGGAASRGGGRGSAAGGGAGGGAAVAGRGTAQSASTTGSSTTQATTGAARGGRGGAATGAGQSTVTGRSGGRGAAAVGGGRGSALEFFNLHTAEVWLIHRTPDNVEHVQQQTVQFGRASRDFSFPPVAVNTPRGVVMVDVNGSLRIAEDRITIGLSRRARASAFQPPLDTTGSSEMTFDMPKPEEVLSFEFPALQRPAEDLLAKHKFSVRVRLR